ncbi:MAG: ArsA-related P-loop ATPase [Thermoanaerobaculia bacterium]|nr:ArsA-related P-loop ATPase [Thermoanaerobaculia bacterium]
MSPTPPLAARQLLVVTGKGGVGKSAVAAAAGKALAAAGSSVLVLEIDPRETVHQMFSRPPSGGEVVEVEPRLYLQNLQATDVLDQLVRERLRVRALVERVLASPVYRQFTGGGPGLKELAVLGHTLRLVRGLAPGAPRVDTVVLDAPATGHGVSLLAAPLLVAEVIRKGPIGELTHQVAELVREPARTGVVAVTLAEEMPVTEALELASLLQERLERSPDLLVVNGLYPPLPTRGGEAEDVLGRLWRQRRQLNEAELRRLDRGWAGSRVELPLWPLDRGPRLVAELAAGLAPALTGSGGGP